MKGTFKARAKRDEWTFGATDKGNEYIAVLFEVTQGEHAGHTLQWRGFFTDKTVDRTLDSLRHCGWDGDDIMRLDGLDRNEVEIVVEEETYDDKQTGERKTVSKVQWVNRPARVRVQNELTGQSLAAFAARFRGKAVAHKQAYGPQPAPTNAAPRTASQQRSAPPPATFAGDDTPMPENDDIPF